MKNIPNAKMGYVFALLVVLLLVGLPMAVWLDLSNLVETNLRRQASDVNSIISSVRNLSFPKIPSMQIRVKRENQRIIRRDACDPSSARNVCRQPVVPENLIRTDSRNEAESAHHLT